MEFISKTEFAQRIGVSARTVHAAFDRGRITLLPDPDRKNELRVPWPDARVEWERAHGRATDEPSAPASAGGEELLADSKKRKERLTADLLEIELRAKKGELLERTIVERQAFEAARRVRDAILNVPNRISDQLAVETDRFKCHKLLTIELNKALEELSKQDWESGSGAEEVDEDEGEQEPKAE